MPIALHTADTLPDLWAAVLRPWLEAARMPLAPGSGAVAVVAPDTVRLAALKRAWLEEGGAPLLGVRFWTPGELRRFLLEQLFPGLALATAEDLALVARLAAGAADTETPLGVVARQPSGFLNAWDAWLGAQARPELFGEPWRPLLGSMNDDLARLSWHSVRSADWALARLPAATTRPPLARILLDGFSPLQAALFPLLQAALQQAGDATMVFPRPRPRALERLWVGTFEGLAQREAAPVPAASTEEAPFARWAEAAELGTTADAPPGVAFHLWSEREAEAAALARDVEATWRAAPQGRIGVVLPNEPLLVRALVAQLVSRGVPVHDTFGYFPVAAPAERVFAAWIDWQRGGQLAEAQSFLEALEAAGHLDGDKVEFILDAWEKARQRTGSDDLAVVTAYLERDPGQRGSPVAVDWARHWPRLDAEARLGHYLEIARAAFAQWGEPDRTETQTAKWRAMETALPAPLAREVFLDWLFGSLRVPGRARHPAAREVFAPIQLISYEMVRSAAWTHLFLAGLNEGLVPAPRRENAFLRPDAGEVHQRQAVIPGEQGEGDERMRPGLGFLVEERSRRAVAMGALFDAIAETETAVTCYATYAPSGEDRLATVLSEVFLRLYRAAYGPEQPLPAVATLKAAPGFAEDSAKESASTAATAPGLPAPAALGATMARRMDPTTPFDGDSFGFAEPPTTPLKLGARDWVDLLRRPAAVWLSGVVRVRPRLNLDLPTPDALGFGLAVHRLLSLPVEVGEWVPCAHLAEEWIPGMEHRATAWREVVEAAHGVAGRPVSPAWREQWGQTVELARELAEAVLKRCSEGWLGTERSLPDNASFRIGEEAALALRGRVDALWVNAVERPTQALVIDFKTGADKPLTPKSMSKGEGLQLVLYAGVLGGEWGRAVEIILLNRDSHNGSPVAIEPGCDPTEEQLLTGLAEVGVAGVFGFGGARRSEFGFVGEYPLTFFPPSSEIVDAKWELTHGGRLPLPKGGDA